MAGIISDYLFDRSRAGLDPIYFMFWCAGIAAALVDRPKSSSKDYAYIATTQARVLWLEQDSDSRLKALT